MYRVRIAPGVEQGDTVTLPKAEARYIARVLRMHPGQEIEAFDGIGQTYRLRLLSVSSTMAQGEVMALRTATAPSPPPLILGQAVPKGTKMDLIVEKCSELGLTTLVPLSTERTIARRQPAQSSEKLARWQRIAEAAARQCGRPTLLDVRPPMSFSEFCTHHRTAPVKIVCWENETQRGLRQVLETLDIKSPIVVLIGPEGGWTLDEIAISQTNGFVTVQLGPRMLRTETAAITVTGIIRYSLGELEPQGTTDAETHRTPPYKKRSQTQL